MLWCQVVQASSTVLGLLGCSPPDLNRAEFVQCQDKARPCSGAAALSSRHRHQAVFRPNRFRLPSTTTTTRDGETLPGLCGLDSDFARYRRARTRRVCTPRSDPIRHRAWSPDLPLVNPHPDPRPPPHPPSQSVSSILILPDIRDAEPSSRRPILPPILVVHNSSSDLHANALT